MSGYFLPKTPRPKFKLGDKVRLNDNGLDAVFGSDTGLAHMKTKVYTIAAVSEPWSNGLPYVVDVDDEDMNVFLLDESDFDHA